MSQAQSADFLELPYEVVGISCKECRSVGYEQGPVFSTTNHAWRQGPVTRRFVWSEDCSWREPEAGRNMLTRVGRSCGHVPKAQQYVWLQRWRCVVERSRDWPILLDQQCCIRLTLAAWERLKVGLELREGPRPLGYTLERALDLPGYGWTVYNPNFRYQHPDDYTS